MKKPVFPSLPPDIERVILEVTGGLEHVDKIKMLKLAKNIEGSGEEKNKDLKLMINEMVREIDKCVALINK